MYGFNSMEEAAKHTGNEAAHEKQARLAVP